MEFILRLTLKLIVRNLEISIVIEGINKLMIPLNFVDKQIPYPSISITHFQ